MGHAFFRFKNKKKKCSRKSLPTPTNVQPRRIPRMEGNSSKETLGAEKLKPALYPDAFPAEDIELNEYSKLMLDIFNWISPNPAMSIFPRGG